jgi:hypothetical protein
MLDTDICSYVMKRSRPAEDYAGIRADLKARGKLMGATDLLIAAHARSLGLTWKGGIPVTGLPATHLPAGPTI